MRTFFSFIKLFARKAIASTFLKPHIKPQEGGKPCFQSGSCRFLPKQAWPFEKLSANFL
jgi:hypothetical protein